MEVIRDNLWLCVDCSLAAVNGDFSGIRPEARYNEIVAGLESLGGNLVPYFDSETEEGIISFSNRGCDCCKSPLAGEFHRFAILG